MDTTKLPDLESQEIYAPLDSGKRVLSADVLVPASYHKVFSTASCTSYPACISTYTFRVPKKNLPQSTRVRFFKKLKETQADSTSLRYRQSIVSGPFMPSQLGTLLTSNSNLQNSRHQSITLDSKAMFP